jgi:hypothetical protein
LAKPIALKPEETHARSYADRLILEQLSEMEAAIKLGELADRLSGAGLGLSAVKSLLASNPERFAYHDRRWIPASRIEGEGRPFSEALRLVINRFGGPMPKNYLVQELARSRDESPESIEEKIDRLMTGNPIFVVTEDRIGLSEWGFVASDESIERAFGMNQVSAEEVDALQKKLGDFDWRQEGAIGKALAKLGSANAKLLGAVAWLSLNQQDPRSVLLYNTVEFMREAFTTPGYVFGPDGGLYPEAEAKKWLSAAVKVAEKLAPTIDLEDAAPIDVKADDVKKMVKKIVDSDASVTGTRLLEEFYEITPSNKTFDDDLANLMDALKADGNVWWVGADRFRKPGTAPDFVNEVPELFQFPVSSFKDAEGELIDVELTDDGLSSTLRKLLSHPLATDVLDEDIMPAQKQQPERVRLVLKSLHRELGTFPMCQIPTGWLTTDPKIQEFIFIDENGRELQVWANHEARLLYGLIDWWYEQPVESGAVFNISKTARPNVFDFSWEEQTDPVVYISSQRMEELREIASRADELSVLDILIEIMGHWPKGADFLTLLAEVNVVRRSTRRLVASLLSSYQCFYQRSGSPVWHFDAKKVELGFDKTKRKFVKK